MIGPVLIVGASARAAATSARRAGLEVVTVDLFADTDTRALATSAIRCPTTDYPHGLPTITNRLPPMRWLYTGGLENHPEIVAAISIRHVLQGTAPGALVCVRNRDWLTRVAGVVMPDNMPAGQPTPPRGEWLWKPARSSGGAGVRISPPGEVGGHRERFLPGPTFGAVFVSTPTQTRLVGVTRHRAATPADGVARFAYRGNIACPHLPDTTRNQLETLGPRLAGATALLGVWGVDFALDDQQVFVLEVNPRLTAAVDVLDWATGGSLVGLHLAACAGQTEPISPVKMCVGKAIFYAPHDLTFPDDWRDTNWADVPVAGERILAGHPVLTMFAEANSPDEYEQKLQTQLNQLTTRLATQEQLCTR